jgi:hypothetical protein
MFDSFPLPSTPPPEGTEAVHNLFVEAPHLLFGCLPVAMDNAQAEQEGKDEGAQNCIATDGRLNGKLGNFHRSSLNVRRIASYRSFLGRSAMQLTRHS